MAYAVVYSVEALDQLERLYTYIADASSESIALSFIESIIDYCDSLITFPERGIKRDDLRPGLRLTSFRRRIVIAFHVTGQEIRILSVFYGGQNIDANLAL